MKGKLFLFLLCVISLSPTLSMGQTVVLTTPTITFGDLPYGGASLTTYFISPASSTSLRRYVVEFVPVSFNTQSFLSYNKVTVLDSLAASTLANLSDTALQFVGIGNLYDDNHDELVVTWNDVQFYNGIPNGEHAGLKIIDLQTGGTRYNETGPVSTGITATLINYSSKTKPEVTVTYTNPDRSMFTRVYRFFTLQTGVTSQGEVAPQKLSLSQNYPNPFNPTTTIEYELTSGGSSNLNIFDLAGRLVRSFNLVGEQTGLNRLVWDGRDMGGIPVATGPYFYQLTSGGSVQQKKMLLLR